jgi:putative transcriptional regulator
MVPMMKLGETHYCTGRFLVAMPGMGDERFARSVIYMCAHSSEGAMGIVVNHIAPNLQFASILDQLEIKVARSQDVDRITVLRGGPVEPGRGFVLHSGETPTHESSLRVGEDLYLSTTLDILRLIADGRGPDHVLFALGYAGWSAGQLETELQGDGWLTCEADPSLLFDPRIDGKYERVLQQNGIDLVQLSSMTGHA